MLSSVGKVLELRSIGFLLDSPIFPCRASLRSLVRSQFRVSVSIICLSSHFHFCLFPLYSITNSQVCPPLYLFSMSMPILLFLLSEIFGFLTAFATSLNPTVLSSYCLQVYSLANLLFPSHLIIFWNTNNLWLFLLLPWAKLSRGILFLSTPVGGPLAFPVAPPSPGKPTVGGAPRPCAPTTSAEAESLSWSHRW